MIAERKREQIYAASHLSAGPTYTVSEARMRIWAEMIRASESEFRDVLWTPSETTLYDWIKAGKIETQKIQDGSIVRANHPPASECWRNPGLAAD
jgi:hypothetical protein